MSKLNTLIWFLKSPEFYPQIFQILKRNKNKAKEQTTNESTNWCKMNCISQENALEILTEKSNFKNVRDIYTEIFKESDRRVESIPVKMGGEGAISLIYHLMKHLNPKNVLETGVAYGWSSLSILLALKDSPDAKLISNDMPYVSMGNEDFVGSVVPVELKSHWELQRLPDVTGIPMALKKFNGVLEFVHYDSDKSYTGRTWATPLLWNALQKGGILMVDDINDNIAFKEFCEEKELTPIIIKHNSKYVGIIKK